MTRDDVRVTDGVKRADGQPDVPFVTLSLDYREVDMDAASARVLAHRLLAAADNCANRPT